jgi:hypothetical protein
MSMQATKDAIEAQARLTGTMDADDGVFFARELEHIKARSYDTKYADLTFREIFPISHDAPEGSTSITVSSYDRVGSAKIIDGYATDLPRVDIRGKQYTVPVKQTGASYGYTTKELRESRLVGKQLDARRAAAVTRANEELFNKIAWNGDDDAGLFGLFNVGGIPTATVATKAAGGTTWRNNATADEILYDMNNAVATMVSTTKMKEQPTRMLLPVLQYQYIHSTVRSPTSASDTTILQFFLDNNQYITEVMPINELDGAGSGGVDVMVIYNPSPENAVFEIPMELKHLPPQLRQLSWEIPCEAETGGLNVYYPLSLAIWEGI